MGFLALGLEVLSLPPSPRTGSPSPSPILPGAAEEGSEWAQAGRWERGQPGSRQRGCPRRRPGSGRGLPITTSIRPWKAVCVEMTAEQAIASGTRKTPDL